MINFFSEPSWWAIAREKQLVQGASPDTDVHEPSVLIIVMAMVGVLVCTISLGAFVFLGLGEHAFLGGGGLLFGLVMLAAGGALLRSNGSIFLSCTGLVLWGLGGALVLINLGEDQVSFRSSPFLLYGLAAVLLLVGAGLSSMRWIQSVMGFGWAIAVNGLLWGLQSLNVWLFSILQGELILAIFWLLWLRGEVQRLPKANWAVFADAAIVGLLCVTLLSSYGVGLAYVLYSLFLTDGYSQDWSWVLWLVRGLNVAAVLFATALLIRVWKLREVLNQDLQRMLVLAGCLLALCAWFSPSLGVVALVAAGSLLTARWRIAVLCAFVALGLLGRFYYQLNWSLAIKGIGVAALGGVLLIGMLFLRKGSAHRTGTHEAGSGKTQLGWLLLGALLAFGTVNWDVRGKEQVIAHGQRILVPLVPVDPRSLMQGDYMALRFDLPHEVREGLDELTGATAYVRAAVNAQGVAAVNALANKDSPLAGGEVLLPLKRLKGDWVLVTDAYFFPEGQGEHFAHGRFGDFRVLPDGRALLVGLADAQGDVIAPLAHVSVQEGHDNPSLAVPDEERREDAPPIGSDGESPAASAVPDKEAALVSLDPEAEASIPPNTVGAHENR